MEEAAPEVEEEVVEPPKASMTAHDLTFRRCDLVNGRLVPRGKSRTAPLMEAVQTMAPSGSRSGRLNVMRVRNGDYVGVRQQTLANFVIRNPTRDGDIRWLLQEDPGFEHSIKEVYLIEGVFRRGSATEVTVQKGYSRG